MTEDWKSPHLCVFFHWFCPLVSLYDDMVEAELQNQPTNKKHPSPIKIKTSAL